MVPLRVGWLQPEDLSPAAVFLVSAPHKYGHRWRPAVPAGPGVAGPCGPCGPSKQPAIEKPSTSATTAIGKRIAILPLPGRYSRQKSLNRSGANSV